MSAIKNIAQIGAGFIPGVGPLVSAGLGAAFDAFGSSGRQGGLRGNQTGSTTVNQNQQVRNIEQGHVSDFRKGLMSTLGDEIARAKEPVYGDAQKAAFLESQNELASAAAERARGGLARFGGLNSGRAENAIGDIEMSRMGNISGFYRDLPFQESQARLQRMTPLLGLGYEFTGRAPVDQNITGSSTSNQKQTFEQEQIGAPWWKQMLQNVGGAIGRSFPGPSSGMGGGRINLRNLPRAQGLPGSVQMLNPGYGSQYGDW